MKHYNSLILLTVITLLLAMSAFTYKPVTAGSYDGLDLALAILNDPSVLVGSSYTDTDQYGHRQAVVLSHLGTMYPTHGSTFILLSTGIAGTPIVTTSALNPGSERGEWFIGGQYGTPRDRSTLTLTLRVPPYMHYLYYDVQFYSAEAPEYIGSQYNDKLTITVNSPSKGVSTYVIDVNSGDFVLNANHIPGTGFDIFATSGNPEGVDWVSTTPQNPGSDAGATALITREHPVSPNELVTITFDIVDTGDNQFDSAAFIDNVMFSGYAKAEIIARKTAEDLNGGLLECGDTVKYSITISNIGTIPQTDNPGNEFEDMIPVNTTYIIGSATASSGTVGYDAVNNRIVWNGGIPAKSSVILTFQVRVNDGLPNNAEIKNQGNVYWDSDEDHINDAVELTDDPFIDDGIDQDGDGETGDDDPTILYVTAYETPSVLIEDFSDDTPGVGAVQSYDIYQWFVTSQRDVSSNFEVALSYHYSTLKSFKVKLRERDNPQYWNYTLAQFNKHVSWWEVWLACGNISEEADLYLTFKNENGQDIATIKFDYIKCGNDHPTDYVLSLFYRDSSTSWKKLSTDYPQGYLYNGWYKLRIEQEGNMLRYTLNRSGVGIVDTKTVSQINTTLSGLKQVVFTSTKNPVVSPIFFFDEHRIGLKDKN
ncbi:MAG: choice-of-anchor L domain-containing protein [Candidatus Thermoplasmatota archaeon]